MPQYWVVGAMWGGQEDQYEEFVRKGHWFLGWEDHEQPVQASRVARIVPGDRIAIKKMSSRSSSGTSQIEIRAIGSVEVIDPEGPVVFVRWVASDLHHLVPSRGCFASIHGPFSEDDEWTRHAFQLARLEHLFDEAESPHPDDETPPEDRELPDLDNEPQLDPDGARRWRLHLTIERKRRNVEKKKADVKRKRGSLECELCGFDFEEFYGDLGSDFCEVHHKLPLSQADGPVRPRLEDLAIVCSNCHRMIHRTHPMMSIEEFRDQLKGRRE